MLSKHAATFNCVKAGNAIAHRHSTVRAVNCSDQRAAVALPELDPRCLARKSKLGIPPPKTDKTLYRDAENNGQVHIPKRVHIKKTLPRFQHPLVAVGST